MEKQLTVLKQQELLPHGMASYPSRMESSATIPQKSKKCIDIFSHTSDETCIESVWYEYAKVSDHLENPNRPIRKPSNRWNINADLREVGQEGTRLDNSHSR
jgi:hypothetical protein